MCLIGLDQKRWAEGETTEFFTFQRPPPALHPPVGKKPWLSDRSLWDSLSLSSFKAGLWRLLLAGATSLQDLLAPSVRRPSGPWGTWAPRRRTFWTGPGGTRPSGCSGSCGRRRWSGTWRCRSWAHGACGPWRRWAAPWVQTPGGGGWGGGVTVRRAAVAPVGEILIVIIGGGETHHPPDCYSIIIWMRAATKHYFWCRLIYENYCFQLFDYLRLFSLLLITFST